MSRPAARERGATMLECNEPSLDLPSTPAERAPIPIPADQRLVMTLRFEIRPDEVRSVESLVDATRRPWLAQVLAALGLRELGHEMAGVGRTIEVEQLPTGSVGTRGGDEGRGVFRHHGDSWTIGWEDVALRFRHARGLSILAHLLRSPGEGIHVRLLDALTPSRGLAEA